MLSLFTIIHPLVDACSVSVLVVGGMTLERVIAYNALAFALQLPLGVLLDVWPRWGRVGFFLGTGLVCAASVLAMLGFCGWVFLLGMFGQSTSFVLPCEIVIVLVEAVLLMSIYGFRRWRLLLCVSLLMNAVSYLTGVLLEMGGG